MMDTTPNPGSPEAVKLGCLCAQIENHYGKGYRGIPGYFAQTYDCPVHYPALNRAALSAPDVTRRNDASR